MQLADIGAGAFFQALEQNRPANCNPIFAQALKPRIALDSKGRALDYGLRTMPELRNMGLSIEQRAVFEFYGYPEKGW